MVGLSEFLGGLEVHSLTLSLSISPNALNVFYFHGFNSDRLVDLLLDELNLYLLVLAYHFCGVYFVLHSLFVGLRLFGVVGHSLHTWFCISTYTLFHGKF